MFVPVKTVIVLSENEDNRSMFIPDLEVQCRHITYSELQGHNKDVYDTRFFRTVVLTGARIFTQHFTENIKPSLPNSCNLVSPWQSCFGSAARGKEVGRLLYYVLVEIVCHHTLSDDDGSASSCLLWQAPELNRSSRIIHCII